MVILFGTERGEEVTKDTALLGQAVGIADLGEIEATGAAVVEEVTEAVEVMAVAVGIV